ncbi:Arc family DNA-binding protein [Brevibacillus sp. SYSU BS000544]|uniref:Arc family DNA-binding protein n=1 Tax=Brevibacillus sp. SYSU BS000544 TaxID=3416443 RepID=UPI003CE4B99B
MSEKKKFLLRIDPKLYDQLERWASDEFRSVNTHIEYILRDALRRANRLPSNQPVNQKPVSDESESSD